MARMPEAEWVGEHGSRRMERYDIVCVHTIVGYAPAHAAHFSVKADGTILQSRDTIFQSGANLNGNPRILAIENEDHGPAFPDWDGSNVPRLTDAQVESNALILYWAHETHGVPLQLCPNSRPGSQGLAYHRQGIDGNFGGYRHPGRVSGGEVWTLSRGKVCPGDNRIDQLPEILDLARQYKENGMVISDNDIERIAKAAAKETVKELLRAKIKLEKSGKSKPLQLVLRNVHNESAKALAELRDINDQLEVITDDGDDEGPVQPPL